MDREEFKAVLTEVLHEKRSINDERHQAEHDYIKLLIEKERRKKELWQKFKKSLVGAIAIALVGGLSWLGQWILEHIRIQ